MSAAWAVTTFAPRVGGLFFTARNAFEMGVFIEFEPYVRVASFASSATDILAARGLRIGRETETG